VDPVELARVAAVPTEPREDVPRQPLEDPDVVVFAVRIVEEALSGVWREVDVPSRSVAERVRLDEVLLLEHA